MTGLDERLSEYARQWQATTALPAVPDPLVPSPVRRWLPAVAASAVVLVAAVTAASVVLPEQPAPGRPGISAGEQAAGRYDANVLAPESAAFFSHFRAAPGGSEAERFGSLREAVTSATAVVVAEVVDVAVTRSVSDVTYVGVVLRPVEVLHGTLEAEHEERVVVEFVAGNSPVADLRAKLPGGYGVWMLRNKAELPRGVVPKPGAPVSAEGDYYRLVSSQGLFVQGDRRVVNPVREQMTPEAGGPSGGLPAPADPVALEAEAFVTLSALIERIRLMS